MQRWIMTTGEAKTLLYTYTWKINAYKCQTQCAVNIIPDCVSLQEENSISNHRCGVLRVFYSTGLLVNDHVTGHSGMSTTVCLLSES